MISRSILLVSLLSSMIIHVFSRTCPIVIPGNERIGCPDAYPGINATACGQLSPDCCYEDSVPGVDWCMISS